MRAKQARARKLACGCVCDADEGRLAVHQLIIFPVVLEAGGRWQQQQQQQLRFAPAASPPQCQAQERAERFTWFSSSVVSAAVLLRECDCGGWVLVPSPKAWCPQCRDVPLPVLSGGASAMVSGRETDLNGAFRVGSGTVVVQFLAGRGPMTTLSGL